MSWSRYGSYSLSLQHSWWVIQFELNALVQVLCPCMKLIPLFFSWHFYVSYFPLSRKDLMLPLALSVEWLRSWAQNPSLKCLPFKNQFPALQDIQSWESSRHFLVVVMVGRYCWENAVIPLIYHCNAKWLGKGGGCVSETISLLSVRVCGVHLLEHEVYVCVWVWVGLRAPLSS